VAIYLGSLPSMATPSSQSLTMAADPAAIMEVIADFESYPDWTGSLKSAKVTVPGENGAPAQQVAFSMDAGLLKDNYELAYDWADDGMSVSWTLVSGQLQKAQQGSYVLKSTPKGTEVTTVYRSENGGKSFTELKVPAPQGVVKMNFPTRVTRASPRCTSLEALASHLSACIERNL